MTPVWFFVCVTICIYNKFKQEAEKYCNRDLNSIRGSLNNTGGANNNNNNINAMKQGLLNNDHLSGLTSQQQYDDDDKNGNVNVNVSDDDKSLFELVK